MGEKTIIAWCDATFNIAWGCTKVSPGCDHCYAENTSGLRGHEVWGPNAPRRTFGEAHWKEPLLWNRKAEKEGVRHRVFCSSMCDVFEYHSQITAERAKLWPLIRQTLWLDWLLLTKRIDRVAKNLPSDWGTGYENVWIGTSVEDQTWANHRIPLLLRTPAKVRFVSYEPALGPIDFSQIETKHHDVLNALTGEICSHESGCICEELPSLDWIIVGGESGPKFRPMDLKWARDVRDQCKATGVAFFFKQSANRFTERGIELDGEIARAYPLVQIANTKLF